MYHQAIIAIQRAKIDRLLEKELPGGLSETPVAEIPAWQARMSTAFGKKGEQVRPLTKEETRFVHNERLMGKISYAYWAERYDTINIAGQALGRMYPLWETQRLALEQIGAIQKERFDQDHPDGVIIDVLKARQGGISTLASSILKHRLTTHANTTGLLASDVPDNSGHLYDMFERGIDHLPWWMKPTILERVKNDEMVFGTESRVFVAASKSTRGADKADRSSVDGKKGQLGRGKTISIYHLSELATWTNPGQIDTSFDPAVPYTPLTFGVRESTAQGWGPRNWWYCDWQIAKAGKGRTRAVFLPWYAEKTRNWLPAPVDWTPSPETLKHAQRAEEFGPRWMKRAVSLTREQLYWYETKRAEAEEKDQLEGFLQEYPADDEEAFQMSGKSIFPTKLRERVKSQARPLSGIVEIRSNREMGLAF